jgi:hypothetical protein
VAASKAISSAGPHIPASVAATTVMGLDIASANVSRHR